jgi:ligand-binding SRPBCC domain-containing protein
MNGRVKLEVRMKTRQFVWRTRIAAPVERVFGWHEAPGALARLTPPGEHVRMVRESGGIRDGGVVELAIGRRPFSIRWISEHSGYIRNRQFRDIQVRGPFARWEHTHLFEPDGADACYLEDRIEYALPLGFAGRWLLGRIVERKLDRLFQYRHQVTREANERDRA